MAAEVEQRGPIFRDIRRYYCEFCGISRSKKSLLTSHLLSLHKEEMEKKKETEEEGEDANEGQKSNNTCEECSATFKKPAHLKQHMLSHSFERPFTCPANGCNASYKRKDHLNRHLLQHQGKLFKCPVENCSKEFSVHGNISRHIKEYHDKKCESDNVEEEASDDGKEQTKYVCKEIGCGKEFKYASKLQKHAESHGKLFSFGISRKTSSIRLASNFQKERRTSIRLFRDQTTPEVSELSDEEICDDEILMRTLGVTNRKDIDELKDFMECGPWREDYNALIACNAKIRSRMNTFDKRLQWERCGFAIL